MMLSAILQGQCLLRMADEPQKMSPVGWQPTGLEE